jgi:hypothetical protein
VLCAGNKAGTNQDRFYRQLILKAEALHAEHLSKRKAAKEKKGD